VPIVELIVNLIADAETEVGCHGHVPLVEEAMDVASHEDPIVLPRATHARGTAECAPHRARVVPCRA
jgi:hypothetical protein